MSLTRVNTPDGSHYFVDAKTGERIDISDDGKEKKPMSRLRKSSKRLNNLGGIMIFFGVVLLVFSSIALVVGFDEKIYLKEYYALGGAVGLVNSIFIIFKGMIMTSIASFMHAGVLIQETTNINNQLLEELLKKSKSTEI